MKCKRVTRSVLAAELYAVAHAFDVTYAFANSAGRLLGRKMPVFIYFDSRTLFESIIKRCSMTEKRLLIDIVAYRNGDLEKLCWIRTQYKIADARTMDSKVGSL